MKPAAAVPLIGLVLIVLALCGVRMHAQPPALPPASGDAPSVAQPPAADKWDFAEDEEEQPTWRQIVAPQAADLVLFPAFVTLALVSFFRKSVRLKYVTLAASVVYLGLFRSQLISIVNIFGVLSWNLPIFRYSLFWYLFAGFTVVSTVLWGRLYCGRICAYGALTQLLDTVVPAKLRREPPPWLEQRAGYVKYGLLAAVVVYFLATRDISIYRYVEPFWMFTGHATMVMWIGLATLLVATVFVRNLYCRFLCPVGAFLGLLSGLTVFRIKRWSECKSCKICEKTCEWGAIRGPLIVKSECVRCDDCERLYMDTQKCPHWIIILRKQDKAVAAARRSAMTALSSGS
jgi:NosR/NirI family transcriptional regulator, nitrous oxide reductase regulator